MFRECKQPRTRGRLNGGASPMERRAILLTDAPTRALMLINQLQLHQTRPVVPTMYLFLARRTTLEKELILLLWRKPRKLQTLSMVCFLSTPFLQLCCFILQHRILSYLLHMLKKIICPYLFLSPEEREETCTHKVTKQILSNYV
jgi:hypothetical protein